jgi:hypothetical protein
VSGFRWSLLIAALAAVSLCACGPSGSATPAGQATAPAATPAAAVERSQDVPTTASHDLSIDEAMGGHTLERHVGKTDAELRARLEREPQISAASTYTDRAAAERLVGAALQSGNRALAAWRERSGRRPNFVLRYRAARVIFIYLERGQ